MAKKWIDFTKREKVIGVLVAGFAVFAIGGIGNAMSVSQPSTTTPVQKASPVTTYKELVETEVIPYAKESVEDSSRASGTQNITTIGVDGVKTKTFKVTYIDDVETAREIMSDVVTNPAVNEVTSIGTYVTPVKKAASSSCDPNYSGACVPIASDVDCAGGSGDGPAYASGPVRVIGADIYGLDRDGNGVGCES